MNPSDLVHLRAGLKQVHKIHLPQELYESRQCLFLLEDSDALHVYESRAQPVPSSHDAAFAALGGLGHVQQVEAIHRKPIPLWSHTHNVSHACLYRLQ